MAGIYIHIPFCKQACTYCNFFFSTSLAQKNELIHALKQEIGLSASPDLIETIYIGGGTPSLLSNEEIHQLLSTVKSNFKVDTRAEITLEANPDNISKPILESWQQAGINRISLGVQSFIEKELQWMNRAHDAAQSLQSIEDIKKAGFRNFSVDLIYGSPLLTNEQFEQNVDIVASKDIPHLSAYALTVEPKTALFTMINRKQSPPVDEQRQAEQFDILVNKMERAGYEQYEISNFAKPGYRSRHNSSYWQGKPYFGFGPAAHSFNGEKIRRWNVANNALYIKSIEKGTIPYEEEILTSTQQLNEFIMIGLRTMEGVNLEKLSEKFGEKNMNQLLIRAEKFVAAGKLKVNNSGLSLTKSGKFFADGIASDLFV